MADQDLTTLVKFKTVDDWARYAIDRFQEMLTKKRIGVTGALFNSFKKELQSAGGDVQAVLIKFAMYGRFVDMGVGNGIKAYERKTNKINLIAAKRYGANVGYVRRQPKRWYNKVKVSQTLRLQEILVRDMGTQISGWIDGQFSTEVAINL